MQEKLDHLGIVALIIGTPLTALMAHEHGEVPLDVKVRKDVDNCLVSQRPMNWSCQHPGEECTCGGHAALT